MIVFCAKELCLQHDSELDLVRVAWIGGRNMRGFRNAFNRLRKLIAQQQVERVVLDLTMLPDISVYDQLWLSTFFMPSMLTLPLRQLVIVLTPKNVYNQQVIEGLLLAVHLLIRFDVQFFGLPDSALQWVTDYSPRLAYLEYEWNQHCCPTPPKTDEVAEPRPGYWPKKPLRLPS